MVTYNEGAGMGSVLLKDTATTHMVVKGHALTEEKSL